MEDYERPSLNQLKQYSLYCCAFFCNTVRCAVSPVELSLGQYIKFPMNLALIDVGAKLEKLNRLEYWAIFCLKGLKTSVKNKVTILSKISRKNYFFTVL